MLWKARFKSPLVSVRAFHCSLCRKSITQRRNHWRITRKNKWQWCRHSTNRSTAGLQATKADWTGKIGILNIPSSQTDTQRRTMDGAYRERSILLLPRLRVYSLSEGKGVCRCFAGEKPNERRRRRKRERGRNTVSCREAGRRKAHTRAHARTHPVRLCVQAECVKPNNVCVVPTKNLSPSTSSQIWKQWHEHDKKVTQLHVFPRQPHSCMRDSEFIIKGTIER